MSDLIALWLPIVLAAVAGFIASSLAWTVLPHHKTDWNKLPDEDGVMNHIRTNNVKPGQYMFPYCEPADFKDEAVKQRYLDGPNGIMTVWPGPPSMGRNMALTFLFFLIASTFIGYITALGTGPDSSYLDVFRISGTAAILAYSFAFIPNAIWFGKPARAVAMDILDGVAYGLITAGIFGWLAV